MSTRRPASRVRQSAWVAVVAAGLVLAACTSAPTKEELEEARNTFACQLSGERLVIRYDIGEARVLMPDADRVVLYQIPATSGIRYSNGRMELRGKGLDLQLIRDGTVTPLADCQPYPIPK